MNYTSFVKRNDFGAFALAARNAARLLDKPLFQVDEKSDSYNLVPTRQALFDRFCSICIAAVVEVPPLEQALINPYLPVCNNWEKAGFEKQKAVARKAQEILDKVGKVKKQSEPLVSLAGTMIKMLEIFPALNDFSGANGRNVMAILNDCLLKLGLQPIRPQYQPYVIGERLDCRRIKVTLVDDEVHGILKTATAMIGWDLDVQWVHCKRPTSGVTVKKEDWTAEKVARSIQKAKPDIVLMDEGLSNDFSGPDVIRLVRSMKSESEPPVFVGNSGGTGEELREAGALGNFQKGDKPSVFCSVARRFQ